MRKILLAILLLVPFLLTAQPDFREGYVINNHGDTLRGTIDYRGDLMMGSICRFLDPAGRIREFSPDSIASYRFNDGKFYVSKDVEGHKFFLEYLVKGLVNLYYLRNDKGDFYFIDKEGERLSAITFTEEHRYDQGVRVNYRSTSHMGLLAYYMQDAPGIKKRVEDLKKPSRSNLMNLVKDYHNTIPGGKERLEFESKKRGFYIYPELVSGAIKYSQERIPDKYFFQNGVLAYIGLPSLSEKLYIKTGVMITQVKEISGDKFQYVHVPLHLAYVAPETYRVRPFVSISLLTPAYSAGVSVKVSKKVAIGAQGLINFNSNGLIFLIPSSLYNFSILGNVSIDLFKR